MESAWLTLQDAILRASCLDDVIRAHDAYLGEILDRALLAPQHEGINMQVLLLLLLLLPSLLSISHVTFLYVTHFLSVFI